MKDWMLRQFADWVNSDPFRALDPDVSYTAGATAMYNHIEKSVVAFAGQLQAWGYDTAANEVVKEVLSGEVNAPDYYAMQDELKRLRELVELAYNEGLRYGGDYDKLPWRERIAAKQQAWADFKANNNI